MAHRTMFTGGSAIKSAQTNAQSGLALVAAVTGRTIVVDKLIVGMSAAGSFNLDSGTTMIFPVMYVPANGRVNADLNLRCAVGEALNYDSTITGNQSIYVEYHIE